MRFAQRYAETHDLGFAGAETSGTDPEADQEPADA